MGWGYPPEAQGESESDRSETVAVPVVIAPSRGESPLRERRSGLWAALAVPGIVWLAAFFIFPSYVVLCIVFGQVDPIFRTPVPVWNPLQWDLTQFTYALTHIVGTNWRIRSPAIVRTFIFGASRQFAVPADRVPGRDDAALGPRASARACCWRC